MQDAARHEARERSVLKHAGGDPHAEVTQDEETLLLHFYQLKVQSVCRELRLPRKVLNTSLTYIKRFYISYTSMDFDPQLIVLTCVYLACKAEECYISAAELGRLSGVPPEALLRYELAVLQGLRFDLLVHSPYRAIEGCVQELAAGVAADTVSTVKAAAYAVMDALLLTDAPLLYTPGQLALAAYYSGLEKAGVEAPSVLEIAAQQASSAAPNSPMPAADGAQQLQHVVAAITAIAAQQRGGTDQEQVAAIDRKLKAWAKTRPAPEAAPGKADKAAKKAARRAEERQKAEAGVGVMGDV
jgi:cyclin H